MGAMPIAIFNQLFVIESADIEMLGKIEIAKFWYYQETDNIIMQKKSLLKAIDLCPDFATSYIKLGQLYIDLGDLNKGKELIRHGLKNIRFIYEENYKKNSLNLLEEHFAYYFKGIYATRPYIEIIEKQAI
jgi:hypothetical protein